MSSFGLKSWLQVTRKVIAATLPAASRRLWHSFLLFPSLPLLLDMMHKSGHAPAQHSCSPLHVYCVQCLQWLAHSSLSSTSHRRFASALFVG